MLLAHVSSSVGWLGAVFAFLGMALVGLTSDDPDAARAAYVVMEPAASMVLVPLALAALLTGLIQSLGTSWGLFRHYWIIFKLVINVAAAAILLAYTQSLAAMAEVASDPSAQLSDVRNPSPVLHAAAALVLLLFATLLAVFKPQGMTPVRPAKAAGRANEVVKGLNAGQQLAASLFAGATGFCANPAVSMHFGVVLALLGASGAGLDARVDQRAHCEIVRGRSARKRERRRGAHVGTREVQADAAGQLAHNLLGEAGIGAGGARLRTVEAALNTGRECTEVVPRCARSGFEHRGRMGHDFSSLEAEIYP